MVEKNLEKIQYDTVQTSNPKFKQMYWNFAVGLNEVDGLKPSAYFRNLMNEHIEGKLQYAQVGELLKKHYQMIGKDSIQLNEDEMQCDLVTNRIYQVIEDPSFAFHPAYLKVIHHELFQDVFEFAGEFKKQNYLKMEPTLNELDSVRYGDWQMVEVLLEECFRKEEKTDYSCFNLEKTAEHIADFTSQIWQVHPFAEGNTRTVAVFIAKYLNSMGYEVTNDLFKDYSVYFRCALVKSAYRLQKRGFFGDSSCLIRFFENLMFDKHHVLDLRDTVVKELFLLADMKTIEMDISTIFSEEVLKENAERVQKNTEDNL